MKRRLLRVDPIACEGRGLCFELLPELISSDDWGFPLLAGEPVPDELLPATKRAVAACPVLALRLVEEGERGRAQRGPGPRGAHQRR